MKKRTGKLISLLLVFTLLLGMIPVLPMTASAAGGVTPMEKWGDAGRIYFTLYGSGVLTWSEVAGATSYDLTIWVDGSLFRDVPGNTSRSYDLQGELNRYKIDSGTVKVSVGPNGNGYIAGDGAYFLYSSPYPKLEAPSNLKWDINGNADWDDVANADGYTLYLYQPSSGAYNHYDLADSYFNCTNYPDVAARIGDGWYYAVRATSTGNYRSSEYNESYRRGHVPGGGLQAGNVAGGSLTFTVNGSGYLTWTPVPDATGYDVNIWTNEGLFLSEVGRTGNGYPLQEKLNEYKKNSGVIRVTVNPKDSENHGGTASFLYASPYGKLEAPTNLYWTGNMGGWSAVDGAESYTVYLYQPSGSAYNHWTTTNTHFDFSSVASVGEDWFFTVKATASNARDSVYSESPRNTGPASTTLYTIGAYAYDDTLGVMDAGGQVYMDKFRHHLPCGGRHCRKAEGIAHAGLCLRGVAAGYQGHHHLQRG